MRELSEIKPVLQRVITFLADSLNVEAAIIDNHYQVVASTANYVTHKGTEVHIPPVEEVFQAGDLVVSRPGYMESCRGCRFQNNCPARLEVLSCIRFEDDPIGIILLSAFNQEGECALKERVPLLAKPLRDTSELIATVVHQQNMTQYNRHDQMILQATLSLTHERFLCIDRNARVIGHNIPVDQMVGLDGRIDRILDQLTPRDRLLNLCKGIPFSEVRIENDVHPFLASGVAVRTGHEVVGAVIKLRPDVREALPVSHRFRRDARESLQQMIGCSPAILDIKEQIKQIARSSSTVLITGETGTGKELAARAIHANSPRSHKPFVEVNCAAIPDTLLESELFGYEGGAFTGARRQGKAGIFETADGGTLFLDEVGDIPLPLQAKLLRVLQDQIVRRIGGNRPSPVDVRIVCASNRDLLDMVRQGTFREDLYYRINVVPLHIPPLRERPGDIRVLARNFLEFFGRSFGKSFRGFSDEVLDILDDYPWPGNVRELRNTVEYAANMANGEIVGADSLPKTIGRRTVEADPALRTRTDEFERRLICGALDKHGRDLNGKKRAARELGIGLRTLYRKMKGLGIPSGLN